MWLKGMYKCFTNQRYIPSEEGSLSSLYLVFLAVCNGRGCLSLWMQMEHDMEFCSCWDISSFNMLMCCAGQHPDANKTSNLKAPMCKKLSSLCWGEWVSLPVSWRKELFSVLTPVNRKTCMLNSDSYDLFFIAAAILLMQELEKHLLRWISCG